jgi:aspartate aminotransferase-like enzyme
MAGARRPGRNFLFVPGPTNVPDRILRAMHITMEDHRSSDFPKLTELMLLGAISGAEMAMNDIGIGVELGSGVAAAQAEFRGATQMREQQRIAAE